MPPLRCDAPDVDTKFLAEQFARWFKREVSPAFLNEPFPQHRFGHAYAKPASEVIVAKPCAAQSIFLRRLATRWRWPVRRYVRQRFKRFGNVRARNSIEPVAAPALKRNQARVLQFCKVRTCGLGRYTRGEGKLSRAQSPPVKKRRQDVGARRNRDQCAETGYGRFNNHISMIDVVSARDKRRFVEKDGFPAQEAEMDTALNELVTRTGTIDAVWLIKIQASEEESGALIDAVLAADPLAYGRYERNAFVSAKGTETYRPLGESTSALHLGAAGQVQSFPCVEIQISIPRRRETLGKILDAIRDAHHYEEPLIFVQEAWASRSAYDPMNANPNRWWNKAQQKGSA